MDRIVRLREYLADCRRAVSWATPIATSGRLTRVSGLAPALGAWATGTAAVDATRAWGTFVGRLHGSVDGVATGMRAAADGYTVADANSARLLNKAR